jgi:CBS domain-containing protein
MNMDNQFDRIKVKEVFNDCTKRPFLSVYPDTKLLQVITFLAIGPEIYVDGVVVVIEENRNGKKIQIPVGRIGGKHILCSILESTPNWEEDIFENVTASQIMIEVTESECVELESPLRSVIDIFERTRFAFVPIISITKEYNTNKPIIIGTLAVRDFLSLIVERKISVDNDRIDRIINQISSPIVSVNKDSTIRDAITLMVNKGIRNVGIRNGDYSHASRILMVNKGIRNVGIRNGDYNCRKGYEAKARMNNHDSKLLCILNDRKIMEYLLSHKRRERPIYGSVSDLDIIQIRPTRSNITVVEAAQYLMDIKNQFLVLEGNERIITPWDLVVRAIYK